MIVGVLFVLTALIEVMVGATRANQFSVANNLSPG
jgi:hypothetical protein